MQYGKNWILGAMTAALLAGGAALAGGFDSPDGEPPYGLDFPDGRSGQQLAGFATILFRGMSGTNAQTFDSVVQLRKGGELHVFYAGYSCSNDSCALCSVDGIDTTQVANIQLCIEGLIEDEVLTDFALSATDVRLKDVSGFKAEPSDGGILVVGSNVEVTVR